MTSDGGSGPYSAPQTIPEANNRLNRQWVRPLLMVAGPALILIIAGYFYLTGGRYVGTDDAYIHAPRISVSADISGRVTKLFVTENQRVKKGDPLFQLDEEPLKIAVAQAEAHLDDVRNAIIGLKATYRQRQEELKAAASTHEMTSREFTRRQSLLASKIISASEYDIARNQLEVAVSREAGIRQDIDKILSDLGGNPDIAPEDHARYRAAEAALAEAQLNLRHALIDAPMDGTIAQVDRLNAGDYVVEGRPVFSLIDEKRPWIEANLKETDLQNVHPGQAATIEIDTYPGQSYSAIVESVGIGTGSVFSVLPAQNATGNWVKVVQRIPVRLRFNDLPDSIIFRAGMSANVEIDTKSK